MVQQIPECDKQLSIPIAKHTDKPKDCTGKLVRQTDKQTVK